MLPTGEFRDITGFNLPLRMTNRLSHKIVRKGYLFDDLAKLYCFKPKRFEKLVQRIDRWLSADQSETMLVLAGYIYYIAEDFKRAGDYFLKAISVNSDNLDNWIDFAFALRHFNEYEVSSGILFKFDYVMYYYNYFKLSGCDYTVLKNLVLEIVDHAKDI